jgi:GT2 family glycosyltransferase
MVRVLAETHPNIRILDLKNGGPGAARNAGARAASGTYLAFTDDDCVVAADWLEQILAAFERTRAVGVQGRTTTDRLARTPLTHQVEVLTAWTSCMPTCNASYLRSVFEAVGGFDDSYRYAHDEDADLAWRAEEHGVLVFAPEVHVSHPPRRDRFLKRARWVRGLESDFLLFYKNKVNYRKYVSSSPWKTIYWNVFVIHQIRLTKSCCRYLISPFKPQFFFIGLGIVLARWFYLLRYLPAYLRAQQNYRLKFRNEPKRPQQQISSANIETKV